MINNNVYKMMMINKIINYKISENYININNNNKITLDSTFIIIIITNYSLLLLCIELSFNLYQKDKIILFSLSSTLYLYFTSINLSIYF
jgi:hypothetical protein